MSCKSHHLSTASSFVEGSIGGAQSDASRLQSRTGVRRLEINSDCSKAVDQCDRVEGSISLLERSRKLS